MKIIRYIGTAFAVAVLFVNVASADLLVSRAGLTTCVNYPAVPLVPGYSGCVASKVVTPHPLWEQSVLGSTAPYTDQSTPPQWISYADTGYGGSQFQPYGGGIDVNTDWIFQVFQPIAKGNTEFHLRVWADDTAGVYLAKDGGPFSQLKAPVFTQSTCSGQPIGCLPQDVGSFNELLDASSAYTLRFDVYQVGQGDNTTNNPMALLYTGYAVPEPASVIFLGTCALGCLGLLRRRLS